MFHAKIKSETLKGIVDVVSTLVDEAKFNIDPEGIEIKAVDPAHVAMVDMRVEKTAFEEFSADDMELGIDLDKIKEVLKLSRGGDILEIDQNDEKNRLIIRVGNIVRKMNLVDTAGMSDPRVPNVALPAKISLGVDELQKGIKAAESVSDHIALSASPDDFEMYSEGDTDSVNLKLAKDQLISLDCQESVKSMFPLDYFSNMVRSIPGGTAADINLGTNYPVRVEFELAEGNGMVNYLLAPRIENE